MRAGSIVVLLAAAGLAGKAAAESRSDLAYLAAGEREAARMENAAKIYEEILQGMNTKPAPAKIATKPAASILANAEVKRFFDEVRFEIQESVEFPDGLKGTGMAAKVMVEFQLNPDGTLRTLKAVSVRPAAPEFEAGAVAAVRRAVEFFPPVPQRLNTEQIKFKVPIVFEDA